MRLSAYLSYLILLPAFPALAHPPYERVAGTFSRPDGITISIVRHYVDGIIAADPVSIHFRLPDGTDVAHTPHTFDAITRSVPSGVEIYQFPTTWLPVASRVDKFDGYGLKEITTSKRPASPFVHFADHWLAYLVATGLAAFFTALYSALRIMPRHGWRGVMRTAGLVFVMLAAGLLAYDIMIFEPVSPFVLIGCWGILTALYRFIRKKNDPIANDNTH
jgi:hypothetical protein